MITPRPCPANLDLSHVWHQTRQVKDGRPRSREPVELLYMSSGWMELFAASQDRAKQHGRLAPDLCEQSSQANISPWRHWENHRPSNQWKVLAKNGQRNECLLWIMPVLAVLCLCVRPPPHVMSHEPCPPIPCPCSSSSQRGQALGLDPSMSTRRAWERWRCSGRSSSCRPWRGRERGQCPSRRRQSCQRWGRAGRCQQHCRGDRRGGSRGSCTRLFPPGVSSEMALEAKDKLTVVALLVIVGVDLEAIDRARVLLLVQAALTVTGNARVVADVVHLKVEAELAELGAVANVGVGGPHSVRVARGLLGDEALPIEFCVRSGTGQQDGWRGEKGGEDVLHR